MRAPKWRLSGESRFGRERENGSGRESGRVRRLVRGDDGAMANDDMEGYDHISWETLESLTEDLGDVENGDRALMMEVEMANDPFWSYLEPYWETDGYGSRKVAPQVPSPAERGSPVQTRLTEAFRRRGKKESCLGGVRQNLKVLVRNSQGSDKGF